jgi:hypothetical protein
MPLAKSRNNLLCGPQNRLVIKMRKGMMFECLALACMTWSLLTANVALCQSGTASDIETKIQMMIKNVQNRSEPESRLQAARELSFFIHAQDSAVLNNLSVKSVEAVASLLDDESEAVKSRIATALGDIGPAARPAIPALEAAKHIKPVIDDPILGKIIISPSAMAEIQEALEKIRREPAVPADANR